MIQVRGQRRWSSRRGIRASLVILSLAAAAGWMAQSARAYGDDSPSYVVDDPTAPRSMAAFDDLAGMDGGSSMTSHTPVAAEGIVYDGETDVCDDACRCWNAWNRPGIFQGLHARHATGDACWKFRTDALILWRYAPASRPLIISGDRLGTPLLDADQLQSTATGGVRGTLLRIDGCTGNAWEASYLFAGNFTAQRTLPYQAGFPYALAPPGIYGNNESVPFDSGTMSLLAQLQGAEFNRHLALGPNLRWLAGFRWLQWQERFSLVDTLDDGTYWLEDRYRTDCHNNLYGGQIGFDSRLLTLGSLRVDSVVKAGAYYNAGWQSSSYTLIDFNTPENSGVASVTVAESPAACSFVGEVGMTGALPITENIDFRFGYLGLWLTGLVQPTQQLSGQQVTPGLASVGTINAKGGTFVQGVTLGLEARW